MITLALLALMMACMPKKAEEPAQPGQPKEEAYEVTAEHLNLGLVTLGEPDYEARIKLSEEYGLPSERGEDYRVYELVSDDGGMWAKGIYYFRDYTFYKVRYESSAFPYADARKRARSKAIYSRAYRYLETIEGTDTSYVSRVTYENEGERKPIAVISVEQTPKGYITVVTYEYCKSTANQFKAHYIKLIISKMKPTDTCLSRMEDGFDSRRRYQTANQILTYKSRCLILSFLHVRVAYTYPFLSAFHRFRPLPSLQISCKFLQVACNTSWASLVIN